ncbi:InlB B-repeat-containing protein [Actinomyces sp. zg-332]|uniref:InlB B-repeat-containing protein n=1 Tax=Actinomyces sp. zg-332 TaxID=2708340 RepID=UPI001422C6F0|nr:InlB B-repeat-containing protein [Actinomyces sp. zg-332]QPK94285.1 InlB B-repeat-containing protein [Actinomyces sp. zg-332]
MKKNRILVALLVIFAFLVPSVPAYASSGKLIVTVNGLPFIGSFNMDIPYSFFINEHKTAEETLPGQPVKQNSNFNNLDATRHAVVNAPAEGGKFDFDATFYMKQSTDFPFRGFLVQYVQKHLFDALVKPSNEQIAAMPKTKEAGVASYVDLKAIIDDRITAAENISAYFKSYSWRPVYVFDENYNLLADVHDSYNVDDEIKNITFPSNGKHTYIIRTVPVAGKDFTKEQLDAPMTLGFNPDGNNNFTISREVANQLAEARRGMTEADIAEEKRILAKKDKLTDDEIATLKRFNLYTHGNISGQVTGTVTATALGKTLTRSASAVVDDKVVPAGIAVTYENPKLTFVRNYDANDETKVGNPVYVEYNKTAEGDVLPDSVPADPTRDGYKFIGWATTRDATAADFDANAPVTEDKTYYAIWKEQVKVTFDSAEGTAVDSQTFDKGGKATLPDPAPTRDGYKFVGWQKDGVDYNFDDAVENDITLKAVWKEQVTVTFDSAGGSNVPPVTVDKDSTVSAPSPAPTRDGHRFVAWQKDGTDYDFSAAVTGNITLIAKWEREQVTVTFDSNGGSAVPTETVGKGDVVAAPTAPTRADYEFAGWEKDGVTYDFNSPVNENITLKAKWVKEKVTVTYDSNGGSDVPASTLEKGEKVTAPTAPTRDGHRFVAWQKDGVDYNFEDAVTENITLKAVWKEQVTVTYDSAGGSNVDAQTFDKGGKATLPDPAPTRDGYKFAGWEKDGATYDFDTLVNENITLTAKWEKVEDKPLPPVVEKVKVTFDSAGGSAVAEQTFDKGGKATLPDPAPTRDGHKFVGWQKDGADYNFDNVVNENITLTAKWEKVEDKPLPPADKDDNAPKPKPDTTPKPQPKPELTPNTTVTPEKSGKVMLVKKATLPETGVNGLVGTLILIGILGAVGLIALIIRKKK